jgi:ribose 5-phosphate isomerase B
MIHIAIGSDHAGFECKELIFNNLQKNNFKVDNMGTYNTDSVDYPDFAHKVAEKVASGDADLGILCCGSGNGVAMAANKHKNIRAALCWNKEISSLAVKHNDANILCIPARFVNEKETIEIVEAFLKEKFEGGRHKRRVDKIDCNVSCC